MNSKFFGIFFILLVFCTVTTAQTSWGTQGKYLTKNGKPIYLSGVNYIVSDGWMINIPNLSEKIMNEDMAALQSIGVNHVRFFPMWQLTQPTINKLDEKVMVQLDKLVSAAGAHNISMQIAPITGFMSGAVFLPPWAVGDVFRDKKIIDGQKYLCSTIAKRYEKNPVVLGYDFGNELNVLVSIVGQKTKKAHTPDETLNWMKQIYPSFKTASPKQLVTNGIGTGYDSNFDIRNIAQNVDYMAPHSYAFFHGTSNIDPWYGQRTTYSANFITSWCEMMGKPVVVQEIGCSEDWLPSSKIGAYLRLNYLSTWADGAAGFLWWGSHDIDTTYHIKSKDMILPMSSASFSEGKFSKLEYMLGLLTTKNTPKVYAETFAQSIETVNKLGLSWRDNQPVCYIIVPADGSFNSLMHEYITSYVMAKQVHFDVKMCYDGSPIPSDAEALIISGRKLTETGKKLVQKYLTDGGKVFQSYENDFATAVQIQSDTTLTSPTFLVCNSFGEMQSRQSINVPTSLLMKKTTYKFPAEVVVTYKENYLQYNKPTVGVLYTQKIGKGTCYYFTGKVENALSKVYNPWLQTNLELLYSVLKPETAIDVDNKYVELYHKTNETGSIIMLLNHSDQYQTLTIKSQKFLKYSNFETQQSLGSGNHLMLTLEPAEVLILNVQ